MRRHSLFLAGFLALAAGPVLAQEPAAKTEGSVGSGALDLLGDVVDGVGGVLKVLVGPPLSPPAPLNLPGSGDPAPAKPAAKPAIAAPNPLPPEPPAVVQPPVPVLPAVVTAPEPPVPAPPATPAVIKSPPPPVAPVVRPPVTRPAASPMPPPPAEPVCRTRAAATATLDQAAKLPRCAP